MLSLTRIFLHNWHRFTDHVIDVEDSLYLAGHNGSGKSSVLDAIQFVLIADLTRVRFNSSAQERSQRNLDTYVRGKLGESGFLRPGNTVAYVALEFTHTATQARTAVGVCVEAGEDRTTDKTFFILPEALDISLFMAGGRERSRRQLRDAIKQRRLGRSFDQVGEYQDELRNTLGKLNPRFFDLFLRALTFQPIRNIRDFVEQWLLEHSSLDLDTLRRVKERLADLRLHAREVEEKVVALREIVAQQDEVRRLRERHAEYTLLVALLHEALAQRRVEYLQREIEQLQQQVAQAEIQRRNAAAAHDGAQQAYVDAQVRLQQSDVVRRRSELERAIAELTQQVATIHERRAEIRADVQSESRTLEPFIASAGFAPDERAAIDAFLAAVADHARNEAADPERLRVAIDALIPILDAARERTQEQQFAINQQLAALRARRTAVQADLNRLLDPASRPIYPRDVERLRDLLTPVVGERPRLLCELLEITDERWQDAVEAMLGGRRFNVIVPPPIFRAALHELNRARAAEKLYDVGLLDLDKARTDSRPPKPGSLALKVETQSKPLRFYIDTILGDIITCETVDELRHYRRAVTPDVVTYTEWTARAIPPRSFRPWFIGQQARQSQIEALQHELAAIEPQIAALEPQHRALQALARGLDRGRTLTIIRQRLNDPLNEQPLQAAIVDAQRELESLDLSGVAALQREADRLKQLVAETQNTVERLVRSQATLTTRLETLASELRTAQQQAATRSHAAHETRESWPQAVAAAESLLAERSDQPDLSEAIRNAEAKVKQFETQATNAQERVIERGTTYNTRYQFAAVPHNPDEIRYAAEEQRLSATDLPRFTAQIEQAQREAEEELREHVLHRLREHMLNAKEQLERINDALRPLAFHGERYRFIAEPASEVRQYYDLINDAQLLGPTALFESEFYERHRATFDHFYDALTRAPHSEAERLEQERLTDYRRYLSYDIEVKHADGSVSKLSKIMGQTSGGETQTPFYVTIAASFVQLYRINERSGQATIRLVAFDEAFSKMDQDRIGATLDLFQHFKLQIITATPLERCEYLVPKMCTSLVLTGVADQVLIEPYRNYAAKLEVANAI